MIRLEEIVAREVPMGADDELPEEFRPKPAKRLHDDPSALRDAFAEAPESLAIGGGKAGLSC